MYFIAQALDSMSAVRKDKIPAKRKTANIIPNLSFCSGKHNPLARFLWRISEERTTQAEDSH